MAKPDAKRSKKRSLLARLGGEVINYVVERWYPDCAFYGSRYASSLKDFDRAKGSALHTAAVTSLVAATAESGSRFSSATLNNFTLNNEPKGDWLIVVHRMDVEAPDAKLQELLTRHGVIPEAAPNEARRRAVLENLDRELERRLKDMGGPSSSAPGAGEAFKPITQTLREAVPDLEADDISLTPSRRPRNVH